MSKQGQRFRAIKDDTTKPTLFKVIQSQTFLNDEDVLANVDEFINNHPLNTLSSGAGLSSSNANYNGINPTVLSQLNRMQRSLRGLPPLFDESSTSNNTTNNTQQQITSDNITAEEKPNKKVVFDD